MLGYFQGSLRDRRNWARCCKKLRCALSSIALGELYSGANSSARPAKNLAQIAAFIAGVTVIAVDDETARHYGQISAQLAAQGTPIPQNDLWIAACARQWGLTLATTDPHYTRIAGLSYEMW